MTFAQIPAGGAVFLDANTLVYHFSAHPNYGAVCTQLVERIEQQDLQGFTSAHVLPEGRVADAAALGIVHGRTEHCDLPSFASRPLV
jgi:hypothetical protein